MKSDEVCDVEHIAPLRESFTVIRLTRNCTVKIGT